MPDDLNELSENGLLAAHRHQKHIIDSQDEKAIARFLHPNFIINGPNNVCGARENVLRLSRDAFAHEDCRSQIEKASLTGNIGILMGTETVMPADESLLAGWFGAGPLRRRFTDVYVFEDGRWLFLARQASVVREPRKLGLA